MRAFQVIYTMFGMNNSQLAKLLRDVAAAYTVKGESFFKIQAYEKAADICDQATREIKELWEEENLDSVPGLGERIRSYLDELFRSGHVKHFEEVMKDLPKGMFELLSIPGIGPKTAYKITKQFDVKTVKDLKQIAQKGLLSKIPGFGTKTQEEIISAIETLEKRSDRILLPQAYELALNLTNALKKSKDVIEVHPLGSLRRMVSTIGDIDLAVSSKKPQKVIDFFITMPQIRQVLSKGEHKATVILKNDRQVDLMVQSPERYGALLQHFTGSKMHNIHLRKLAKERGLSLSEYGITKFHQEGDQFATDFLMVCKTEEEFYKRLDLDYIPPELREDTGEIEAASTQKLPQLVKLGDIKGDIHIHSDFPVETSHDLGLNSMRELIKKSIELGYEYIGFSDHNPSVQTHTENQVLDILKRRKRLIEQINSSVKKLRVLNLLEVDVMADSRLAITEGAIDLLDGMIVSVHSSFRQSREQMTKRIINALDHPKAIVFGHPTGRLINSREGYEVDWDVIFDMAKKKKKLLEINSWPERLDLPDTLVREAVRIGVKFVINTDSHAVSHMDNMRFGVAVARRGWVEKDDIANTLPWVEFCQYFRVKL